jgi:hypothetical protein
MLTIISCEFSWMHQFKCQVQFLGEQQQDWLNVTAALAILKPESEDFGALNCTLFADRIVLVVKPQVNNYWQFETELRWVNWISEPGMHLTVFFFGLGVYQTTILLLLLFLPFRVVSRLSDCGALAAIRTQTGAIQSTKSPGSLGIGECIQTKAFFVRTVGMINVTDMDYCCSQSTISVVRHVVVTRESDIRCRIWWFGESLLDNHFANYWFVWMGIASCCYLLEEVVRNLYSASTLINKSIAENFILPQQIQAIWYLQNNRKCIEWRTSHCAHWSIGQKPLG